MVSRLRDRSLSSLRSQPYITDGSSHLNRPFRRLCRFCRSGECHSPSGLSQCITHSVYVLRSEVKHMGTRDERQMSCREPVAGDRSDQGD